MLKLKEVYALPAQPVDLTQYVLREEWIPELQGSLDLYNGELLEELQTEQRLQLKCLVDDYIDGHRVVQMHTLWFDGHPLCIVQNAGRSGRDHSRRWVTDPRQYLQMLAYLVSKIKVEANDNDLADPEEVVYEEEVFCFYGSDFASRFGYTTSERTPGYLVFPRGEHLVPGASSELVLVSLDSRAGEPAEFIRRGSFVMQRYRALSRAELDLNPRLEAALIEGAVPRYFWYRQAARPDDQPVVSV